MFKKSVYYSGILLSVLLFAGWGRTGHNIISNSAPSFFPKEMSAFVSWQSYLASHASDADYRKSDDPDEAPKHFIDIDVYSEFNSTGRISQSLDSMQSKYGKNYVIDQGILPWALIAATDSLTSQFRRRDWNKAQQTAADLGHYVGDAHMPLHITKNYNGQLSGQYGVHSRYESTMVDKNKTLFAYAADSVGYVADIPSHVFGFIYSNYSYADSVLAYDKAATAFANGDNKSEAYYQKLWELTGGFTNLLFKKASHELAALIYTAWINAGRPDPNATGVKEESGQNHSFLLEQNYPNPFNPETVIKYSIPKISTQRGVETPHPAWAEQVGASLRATLKIYDMLGREIVTLVDEMKAPGNYEIRFDGSDLSSGVYLYRLSTGSYVSTKKMLLIR